MRVDATWADRRTELSCKKVENIFPRILHSWVGPEGDKLVWLVWRCCRNPAVFIALVREFFSCPCFSEEQFPSQLSLNSWKHLDLKHSFNGAVAKARRCSFCARKVVWAFDCFFVRGIIGLPRAGFCRSCPSQVFWSVLAASRRQWKTSWAVVKSHGGCKLVDVHAGLKLDCCLCSSLALGQRRYVASECVVQLVAHFMHWAPLDDRSVYTPFD